MNWLFKKMSGYFSTNKSGIDKSEIWNLDKTIAEFVYPRLVMFTEMTKTYPPDMTPDEWKHKLLKMKRAFQIIVDDELEPFEDEHVEDSTIRCQKVLDECKEGLHLFADHLLDLWD